LTGVAEGMGKHSWKDLAREAIVRQGELYYVDDGTPVVVEIPPPVPPARRSFRRTA